MGPTTQGEIFTSKATGWVQVPKPAKVSREHIVGTVSQTLWLGLLDAEALWLKSSALEDNWGAAVGLRLLVMEANYDDLLPLTSIIIRSSFSEPSLILVLLVLLLCLYESS